MADKIRDDAADRPLRTRRSLVLRGGSLLLLVAVGLVYFASTLISAGPMTPMALAHGGRAAAVLDPYFQQNWQLFAPDPISEERGIVARARCADGSETPFVDVTTEHIDAIHSTRFFPSRKSRLISNGLMQVFLQDPYLVRFRTQVEDGKLRAPEGTAPVDVDGAQTGEERSAETGAERDQPEADQQVDVPLSDEEREVRRKGETVLVRLSAWSLRDECTTPVEAIQLRYVLHKFPRWSEREQWRDNGEISILESEWFTT